MTRASDIASTLAREVQAWRRLVNGGPCETCDGDGCYVDVQTIPIHDRDGAYLGMGQQQVQVECCDCQRTGTRPGLIERLEAMERDADDAGRLVVADELGEMVAALRGMTS